MHWSEWAALILLIIIAIPLLVLVVYCCVLGWGMVSAFREHRKPRQTVRTPLGEFVKSSEIWSGEVTAKGSELQVLARDVAGQPNPELLQRLPGVLQHLDELERTARQQVSDLTVLHQLASISDGAAEAVDFELGFDDEYTCESVMVQFRAGEVVGSYLAELH
ncbi:MAG: hypothetical protein ACK47B_23460 [Armatimonadota bacterium]